MNHDLSEYLGMTVRVLKNLDTDLEGEGSCFGLILLAFIPEL